MGKITSIAIGVMIVFTLIGMMSTAIYNASPDTSKTAFQSYKEYQNFSELNENNLTTPNSNNSVSNMQRAAEVMANKMSQSQRDWNSDTIEGKIAGAFGLLSTVTIDVVLLLFAVLFDGVNFIGGIIMNVNLLPTPWNMFGALGVLGIALFIVYAVFKIASALTGRDI